MIDFDRITEHWTGQLAKSVFYVVGFLVVTFGALTMWGLPGPTLPQWVFFGMSPQQTLLAWPITAVMAAISAIVISAPFWILALIVQAMSKGSDDQKLMAMSEDSKEAS